MYWILQNFDNDIREWVDTNVGHGRPPEFKGKGDAFDYYFGKHGSKRNPEVSYRLSPVFSTQPVNIKIVRAKRGRWVLPDRPGSQPLSHLCPHCGCCSHPIS